MIYLSYFYGFCISVLVYILLVKIIPLPHIPPPNNLLPFYHNYIFPESHKLFAYFLGILTIVIGTSILGFILKNTFYRLFNSNSRAFFLLSILSNILSIAIVLFILYRGITTLTDTSQIIANNYFLTNPLFYLLFTFFFISLLFWYFYPQVRYLNWITKTANNYRKAFVIIILLLIIVTLFDRTMEEKNIFIGKTFQYSHSVVFLEPIYDILHGKVLLVDTDAQYGLFINYLPALVFGLTHLSVTFANFFYLMIIYGIFYYFAVFIFLKKKLEDDIWAAAGLIVLFVFHFYATGDRYLRPMFFPIRYILDIPFFLLLLTIQKKKFGHWLLSVYLAISILYNYETGIALTVSYLFYKTISKLCKDSKTPRGCANALPWGEGINIFLSLTFLIAFYSFYAYFQTGRLPDWPRALFYVRLFGSGFIASDGPIVSFYLIPLVIYFAVLIRTIYLIVSHFRHRLSVSHHNIFDASFAVYGLLIFIYYVERSYPPNLSALSIPAIILGISMFKELATMKKSLFAPFVLLGSFIVFSLVYYPFRLAANAKYPYWAADKKESAALYDKIQRSSRAITKYEKDTTRVTIVSFFDTLYEMHTGKLNSLPYGSIQNIFTASQEKTVLNSIQKSKPKYIYVSTDAYPEDRIMPQFFEYLYKNYRAVDTVDMLNVWGRI